MHLPYGSLASQAQTAAGIDADSERKLPSMGYRAPRCNFCCKATLGAGEPSLLGMQVLALRAIVRHSFGLQYMVSVPFVSPSILHQLLGEHDTNTNAVHEEECRHRFCTLRKSQPEEALHSAKVHNKVHTFFVSQRSYLTCYSSASRGLPSPWGPSQWGAPCS